MILTMACIYAPMTSCWDEHHLQYRKDHLENRTIHGIEWSLFIQKIVDSFWKRWERDVFPTLVPRKKWIVEKRNVRLDDIVVTKDENAVRGSWTVGRVVSVYPGEDGRVRNEKIKTATSEYQRPVTKIAVIHPAEGYEQDE